MADVNYKLIDHSGKVQFVREPDQCYLDVFRNRIITEESDHMLLYQKEILVTEEEAQTYMDFLKEIGLTPFTYTKPSSEGDYHQWILPIDKSDTLLRFCMTLTALRYMFEAGSDAVIKDFVKELKNYPTYDKFKLLQIVMNCHPGTGHTFRNVNNQGFLELETFQTRLKTNPVSIYGSLEKQRSPINNAWFKPAMKGMPPYLNSNRMDFLKMKEIMENTTDVIKVYIVGGRGYSEYVNWFKSAIVDTVEEAELVLFTGGEDVDPSLYGETPHPLTHSNITRDKSEMKIFERARQLNKPLLGICRGAQFLTVMAGHKLVQHQENPNFLHKMATASGEDFVVTSTHHQAMLIDHTKRDYNFIVLGWSTDVSKIHQNGKGNEVQLYNLNRELEVVNYLNIKALCIQPHPEMLDPKVDEQALTIDYFRNLLYNHIK